MTEPEVKAKYKNTCEVTSEECLISGQNCATCMYCVGNHRWGCADFEHTYCLCAKKEET